MPSLILARCVLLEARRGGLPWLVAASIAAGLGLAGFLAQVAITESDALQSSIVAALWRACAVFLIAAHVAASAQREIQDKALELMLALPLSRATHYAGRLAGHVGVGAAVAACFALPLLLWAPPTAVAAWGISLALETALIAAAALFFATALASLVAAIASVAGLYVLARAIGAIQAIAAGSPAEPTFLQQAAHWSVEAVALLLPRLDAATRTEWLLYGAPAAGEFAGALGGVALYAALLLAAGLFDFQRRSL